MYLNRFYVLTRPDRDNIESYDLYFNGLEAGFRGRFSVRMSDKPDAAGTGKFDRIAS